MKLELKHVLPYLPNLKIQWEDTKEIMGVTFDSKRDFVNDLFPLDTINLCIKRQYKEIIGFKLILRPLSDLTKEIEHNGETFVPETELLGGLADLGYVVGHNKDYFCFRGQSLRKQGLSFSEYMKLFEWHFDVFNLIKNGLAIDINTLEK